MLSLVGLGDSGRALPPADPPASMLIQVEIDAIQPYDLNPRRQENPEFFARLCDSILEQGLDNPIPITRRPGVSWYMVAAGGNTRLKALRRLREQYPGDERFAKVPCIFRPYTSETDLIAAHLRENDLRDSLVFIDHAHAIVALKRRLEQDSANGGPLTQVGYEKWLERMGHKVSRRDIDRMEYAVAWLDEAIPIALSHGAGPRLIDLIGRLHKFYGAYWDDLDPEVRGSTAFDPLFLNALNAYDGETIPVEAAKDGLNQRIMEVTGIPAHRVKAGVEALMGLAGRGDRASDRRETPPPPVPAPASPARDLLDSGAEPETLAAVPADDAGASAAPEPPEVPERVDGTLAVPPDRVASIPDREKRADEAPFGSPPGTPSEPGDMYGAESNANPNSGDIPVPAAGTAEHGGEERRPAAPAENRDPPTTAPAPSAPAPRSPGKGEAVGPAGETPDPASESGYHTYLNPVFAGGRDHLPRPDDLKSLRGRVVVHALRVAQAAGLQALVQPDPEAPAGFAMRERPDPDQASERETVLWWLLNALSAGRGFDFVARSPHVCVYDPAAFAGQFLFRFDNGRPPPDSLLHAVFLLVESIVALARATAGSSEPTPEQPCGVHHECR